MTTVIKSIQEWRDIRKQMISRQTIGFVPTMGNLHAGHESLLQRAKQETEITVLSIFVNPTQFNNADDLKNYPRTLDDDIAMAEHLKINYVIAPAIADLYPDNYSYQIHETLLSQSLEGKCRPGHFTGMLTIVLKLLLFVKPDRAYFGEKDFQQLQLVRGLAKAFFLDTEIVACATIRNENGLPLSSRNGRLTKDQFQLAERFIQITHSNKKCEDIIKELTAEGIVIDYIEDVGDRRFAAVRIGDVRLIDNISLAELKNTEANTIC